MHDRMLVSYDDEVSGPAQGVQSLPAMAVAGPAAAAGDFRSILALGLGGSLLVAYAIIAGVLSHNPAG